MDWIDTWLVEHKPAVGAWVAKQIDYLNTHAADYIDAFSDNLGALIDTTTELLLLPSGIVLTLIFTALIHWRQRQWGLTLFTLLSLCLIISLGYWEQTIETLVLVLYSTFFCMLVGIPLGIAAADWPWLGALLRPILDLMQTIPTFVYLIPTLILFGLGSVPALISTIIFAIAAPIRLTTLGIASVPNELREAGMAFGANRWQLLWRIELPHAMPTIMAGLTQAIMLSLSMVVIASMVGAGGLGQLVMRALNSVNIKLGFEAGLAIVILAILLDRGFRRPEPDAESMQN